MDQIQLTEMQKEDISFLKKLWNNKQIMRYADEFPNYRGWSKRTSIDKAWEKYQEKKKEYGKSYTQLILKLADETLIGESFIFPLPEKSTFLGWNPSDHATCIIADIKLLPKYWGKGLGTKGMKHVVNFVFTQTNASIFIVPPHVNNPAATQVYTKAGFTLYSGHKTKKKGHRIMELSKESYTKNK